MSRGGEVSFVLKRAIYGNSSPIFCVSYTPDNKFILIGCEDGHIRIFDSTDGRQTYEWNVCRSRNMALPVSAVRFRPYTQTRKNIALVAGAGGTIQHWHITSGRCLNSITERRNQIYSVDYRADGQFFASAGKDSSVRVYDEATRQLVTVMAGGDGIQSAGHSNRVFVVRFHPTDENILLSGGWDNTVQIWDKRRATSIRRIFGPYICGDALDVDDKGVILTGSWRTDRQLQLWDFGTGRLIEDINVPVDKMRLKLNLYCASFNHVRATFIGCGGSGANEAKLLDRFSGKVVGEIKGLDKAICALSFAPDNANVAFAGRSGDIYVLQRSGLGYQ